MSEPRFDPGAFYEFDLPSGRVRGRTGERVIVLSEAVLGPLVAAASSAGDLTPVRTLGALLGDEVVASLGRESDGLSTETVLSHAAAIFAMHGFGKLGVERWGDAMVLAVTDTPTLDEMWLGLAALLGGMFSQISRREVACVPVEPGRFLVVDPSIAGDVWNAAQSGASLGAICGSLASGGVA